MIYNDYFVHRQVYYSLGILKDGDALLFFFSFFESYAIFMKLQFGLFHVQYKLMKEFNIWLHSAEDAV